MSSKTTNKGVVWLHNEVCALLDVWADRQIQQQLAGRLHNMCVYEKISKRLADLGINRTGEQCREKIKKLKRDYKTVVDNNYSPAFARKLLGSYDKVNEIFGKCTIVKPSFVIESIVYNENFSNNEVDTKIESCLQQTESGSNSQSDKQNDITQQTETKNWFPDSLNVSSMCKEKHPKTSNTLNATSIKSWSKNNTNWNKFKNKIKRHLENQRHLHKKLIKKQTVLHKNL
ncbi:uncharacterized protein CEXT_732391 [Caerostris extrusa]|uniref:Myb/SANT-like DNA-binding domain-containing protein n=1 Tax=Caerostris extrusa TaxID=172846 RepID=A0AAV4UZQ4_CAEEX|nr:uncharacterized protein CEXT_732391 [Caerostris extrusa]